MAAPTYQTFADEESLISQPPKTTSTRKAAGVAGVAALVLAALGVSTTVSRAGYSMLDIVSAASGGIDFGRSVKTLAPGYDFNLDLDPGCTATDMYGCSAADLAWGDKVAVSATAISSAEFATNLTLPRKAPNLGPFKKIKVDPGIIYLKDATGTTLVELDVELTVD